MKTISLSKLLLISFSVILLFALAMSVLSLIIITDLANESMSNHQQITKPFEHMVRFSIAYGNVRSGMRDIGRATEEDDNIRHRTTIENNLNDSLENLQAYYDTVSANKTTQEKYDAVVDVYDAMRDYADIVRSRLIPAGMANDTDAVFTIITSDLSPYGTRIREQIDFLATYSSEQGYASAEGARSALFRNTLYSIIGIGVLLAVSISIYIPMNRQMTKLRLVTEAAERISIGDIDIDDMDAGSSPTKNEVILLERAFTKMIDSFRQQAYILARVAEGDYTSRVNIRSDKDVINTAIALMLEETMNVLNQVASAGIQVSSGSKQIAEGAQQLASGSTQQAATVEELSTSMSVIADKTKDNAEMASKAASLAGAIKDNAEKGSNQMSEMVGAVKEINQAGQDISKVIKVINDIAFQTNILALNAAVEAARAGQHGKGFAVVAEEVRNLAAKSAEAARDTGGLISNTIEKAELGSRIANDTAASLDEIVSGINESTQIVTEIAVSSNEQYQSIKEINKGVEQVAQVVQQNSATAEESAAASAEMSGQSAVLEELITQFQLGDAGKFKGHQALPPASAPSEFDEY